MLKVLLKKQFAEVFKNYFYDAKKNKMRSKLAVAGWIIFFIVLMVGCLGSMFTYLAWTMCRGLAGAGMGWLYFLMMIGMAIAFGAFGSVFNTYSGLYMSQDNDLLLSMPIPVRTIIASRLLNVYLLGAMYAAVVLIPTLLVYWICVGVSVARVVCGILLFLIVTGFVLLLSCLLGWVVAKISLRMKHKSFVTVLVSLVCIGAYYFFYFKANDFIQDVLVHAAVYGTKIKGAAYFLYLFGRIGEGDWLATLLFLTILVVFSAGVWVILSRSFLNIATATGRTEKVRYVEKEEREKSVFSALLGKELARFTVSANYMLNCGLGILLIPVSGVMMLVKGRVLAEMVNSVFSGKPDFAAVVACTALCMLSAMNDMATPSISLEGKSLWVLQSLPVEPKLVLRAKVALQLILTGIPMLFTSVCAMIVFESSLAVRILLLVMPLVYTAFSAVFDTVVGVRMPLLNWTSETAPIKQSGAVLIVLFGGWAVSILLGGVYLFFGYRIGAAFYLLAWTVLFAVLAWLLLRWLDRKGAEMFAGLSS